MKFIGIAIMLLCLVPVSARSADLGMVRMSLVKGDVQINTGDTQEWVPAAANMVLREGDRIWVPDQARTEIQVRGGVYIRLDAGSSFDILVLEEESSQFSLNQGHAYINNRKGEIDHIQIDSPLSSVGCYDNSLVMIDVAESGATEVSVLKGYSYAETRSGKTLIQAGNSLYIRDEAEAEMRPLGPSDQWEKWNRSRDRKLAEARESLRYLPDELEDYAADLDDNGRWVYAQDYGYVWTPQVSVSLDWAPYRMGRWVWIGGNYVWISQEPWGWAPYHYGRWAFVARIGWCWVPPHRGAAFWAPGYVGWVHTPTYVAWVPLAPGETYYGYGNYGPQSVNITNVTINRTAVRQEFRNINVRNSFTAVNRNAFVSGRKQEVRPRENPFLKSDVNVGPPAFKPQRGATMPSSRHIPSIRQPPENIKRVRVEDIRQKRRVVPEEKGSVFRPERPPGELKVKKREEPQWVIRGESRTPSPAPGQPQPKVRGGEERGKGGQTPHVTPRQPIEKGARGVRQQPSPPAGTGTPPQQPRATPPPTVGQPPPKGRGGEDRGKERQMPQGPRQQPVEKGGRGAQQQSPPPTAPGNLQQPVRPSPSQQRPQGREERGQPGSYKPESKRPEPRPPAAPPPGQGGLRGSEGKGQAPRPEGEGPPGQGKGREKE